MLILRAQNAKIANLLWSLTPMGFVDSLARMECTKTEIANANAAPRDAGSARSLHACSVLRLVRRSRVQQANLARLDAQGACKSTRVQTRTYAMYVQSKTALNAMISDKLAWNATKRMPQEKFRTSK